MSSEAMQARGRLWVLAALVAIGLAVAAFVIARSAMSRTMVDGIYQRVDLASLGRFDLDASAGTIADVPAEFRALDGKKVALV